MTLNQNSYTNVTKQYNQ